MNYLITLALLAMGILALRQAGRDWLTAIIGGVICTVVALLAGVAISQAMGFPHPSMAAVAVGAVAFVAFVGVHQGK